MDAASQEPLAAIESALVALRLGQGRGPGGLHGRPGGAGRPPWGSGTPPWGDGPPPWGDGPPPWARGGHGHDHSLGAAARFRLLDALLAAEAGGTRMGISEVASAIGVDHPRASRLVNEAAERGFVLRGTDPADARRSVIVLTEAGRTLLESARATRRGAVADAVAGFTADEVAQLAALLTRFAAAWPR